MRAAEEGRENSAILTVARSGGEITMQGLFAQLNRISAATGKNPLQIASEYVRLATGPGKISPADFLRLRLFDDKFYSGASRGAVVGQRYNRDICYTVNYRHDWLGLLENKVSSFSYLNAYGLPTIPLKAIYAPQMKTSAPHTLYSRSALEDFLERLESYPLFGKPVEGFNSLGSIGLMEYLPSTREAKKMDGSAVKVGDLAAEIERHYPTGYMFQKLMAPEKSVARMCGERLATARFVTIAAENGVQIFRAVWKIPAGGNTADNYWRPGNLLAQVDMQTGNIRRVTSGAGLEMQEHTAHPDSATALIGFTHPQWDAMKALALEGARLMRTVPLIGWDLACTDAGPVIVEMNEYPDAFMTQFAERRGILDETFTRFIAYQKHNAAAFQTEMKSRFVSL
jgi:hypothetical protein